VVLAGHTHQRQPRRAHASTPAPTPRRGCYPPNADRSDDGMADKARVVQMVRSDGVLIVCHQVACGDPRSGHQIADTSGMDMATVLDDHDDSSMIDNRKRKASQRLDGQTFGWSPTFGGSQPIGWSPVDQPVGHPTPWAPPHLDTPHARHPHQVADHDAESHRSQRTCQISDTCHRGGGGGTPTRPRVSGDSVSRPDPACARPSVFWGPLRPR
jgi:hypothetical protein